MTLCSSFGSVARDEPCHDDRDEKDSGHAFQRRHDSDIRIQGHDPTVAYAGQRHHTEIEKGRTLSVRNRLVEGVVDEAI